jgi:pimeloyl-ACP methyl ester carboxylesterase
LAAARYPIYATEYGRTEFTGALQGYRVRRGTDPKSIAEMHTFSGRAIDVPSMFVAGTSDWGMYQTPGAIERMQGTSCTNLVGVHRIEGAGHWVQQEQPAKVSELLIGFVREHGGRKT